jgi:hypothetical protein
MLARLVRVFVLFVGAGLFVASGGVVLDGQAAAAQGNRANPIRRAITF